MKRTVLAVLAALSVPLAAAADARTERRPELPPPPPAAAPAWQVRGLHRLVDGYLAALERPGEQRRVLRLEAEVARAIDRELTEARLRLAALRPEPRRDWRRDAPDRPEWRRGALAEARAQVERLQALQADFARLQERPGRRAAVRKAALAQELLRLAARDDWRAPSPPALAWRHDR